MMSCMRQICFGEEASAGNTFWVEIWDCALRVHGLLCLKAEHNASQCCFHPGSATDAKWENESKAHNGFKMHEAGFQSLRGQSIRNSLPSFHTSLFLSLASSFSLFHWFVFAFFLFIPQARRSPCSFLIGPLPFSHAESDNRGLFCANWQGGELGERRKNSESKG